MDDTIHKFQVKKGISILLMVLAFVMLNLNWIKFSDNNMEFAYELQDDFNEDMEFLEDGFGGDIEEALKEQGYTDAEVKDMIKVVEGTEKAVNTLVKGKYSVWSGVSLLSALSDLKPGLTSESIGSPSFVEEMKKSIQLLQIVFGVIVGCFGVVAILMLLTIYAHIKNKRNIGIGAMVLTILMALFFGFFGLVARVGIGEPGNGITVAPILTAVFTIISCIVWENARKDIPKQTTDDLF